MEFTTGEYKSNVRSVDCCHGDDRIYSMRRNNIRLTLSGDTMTITVNDDTIITIDGTDATPDDLQLGDTVSFFLDGEVVTSLSVGMPEPAQPKQSMQAPEQK